jgi:hypothetical protein
MTHKVKAYCNSCGREWINPNAPAQGASSRAQIVKECREAVMDALGSFTSENYVMQGPAGLARYMLDAIDIVALTSTYDQPIENKEDGAS